uniref:Uncharacterized protein n=1 Tax=viral metagenome TaxID=1070528 RepID=A0A6M3L327_9ZZZZ
MADRILVWTPTTHDTAFYLEEDYAPEALRLYAVNAPTLGDLVVDILEDGVSIMQGGSVTAKQMTKTNGKIFYGTYDGAFQEGELVSGTSGAGAEILESKPGELVVWHTTPKIQFAVGETITGASSTATATVDAWGAPQEYYTTESSPITSNARLEQGENLNEEAEDFGAQKPTLQTGSMVTLKILEYGGASNITVQLELEMVSN